MRRRVDVRIDRIAVDPALVHDRTAFERAVARALDDRLRAPSGLDRLGSSAVDKRDGGTLPSGGLGEALGSRIGGAIGTEEVG